MARSDLASEFYKALGPPSEKEAKTFSYVTPETDAPRKAIPLCRTASLVAMVQVMKRQGGETSLHSHKHLDGFWFVLKGRVRFYTADDVLVGEFGPHQGILVPRDYKYWFENVGDDDLEVLLIEARDMPEADARSFLTPDWYVGQDRIDSQVSRA